jgi:hypothetical protein
VLLYFMSSQAVKLRLNTETSPGKVYLMIVFCKRLGREKRREMEIFFTGLNVQLYADIVAKLCCPLHLKVYEFLKLTL